MVASSANALALSARTDGRGDYSLKLPAGTYIVAAWVTAWQGVGPNGIRTDHASEFRLVRITGGSNVRMDIGIAVVSM